MGDGEGSGAAKAGTALLSACCGAAVVDENCRSSIAATAAGCPGMAAEGIEATVVPAHA
jgi:hypothetical protein